jgi:hypothetical protein
MRLSSTRFRRYGYTLMVIGGCGLGIQAVHFMQQSALLSLFAAGISVFSIVVGVILSARK